MEKEILSSSQFNLIPGYLILECLGESDLGILYKAKQLSMDRFVVIKILKPKLSQQQLQINRFLREIQILGRLNHPYILQTFESGKIGSLYYIVTEYCDGIPLNLYLKGNGIFPESMALVLGNKILCGLVHIWKNNLIHRELVPRNILICNRKIKICDFDWVRIFALNSETTLKFFPENLPFISPEQIRGRKTDFRSDIYSLGCIMYWMLLGKTPYTNKVIQDSWILPFPPIESIRKTHPEIQECTQKLILQMLSINPKERFNSIDDIKSSFHQILGASQYNNLEMQDDFYEPVVVEKTKHSWAKIVESKYFLGILLFLTFLLFWIIKLKNFSNLYQEIFSHKKSQSAYFDNQASKIFEKYATGVVLIKEKDQLGSGVLINHKQKTIILTNAHVVEKYPIVNIFLKNNEKITGKVIKLDLNIDIALIQIEPTNKKFTTIEIEKEPPKIGEDILVIGHPRGYRWSLTKGTISGIRGDNIQTDASIHPGNSGGPILNQHGKMVGMTSFIIGKQNSIGFGIGIPKILEFLDSTLF